MSFEGRVSIVTGGTRGIGAGITRDLVERGGHVAAVFAHDRDGAEEFAATLAGLPGTASLHQLDVSDRAGCFELVAKVAAEHGRLDHLVNNAALMIENNFARTTQDEWESMLHANLSGPFYLSQAAVGPMSDAGYGRIVHVGSVTALMGSGVEVAYGASKAGLTGLTRSMARSVARKGITVNLVVPGIFETRMARSLRPEAQAAVIGLIPLGRRGEPEELSHAVLYLLDERASYVTGSVVTVDGGLSMGD